MPTTRPGRASNLLKVTEPRQPETKTDLLETTDPVARAQGKTEDRADLTEARSEAKAKRPSWFRLGPGLITGAADDDPTAIGTYSIAGAQFGYRLLWLAPLGVPLMIAVQEMCGRAALVTSQGLAAIIKRHYPRWVLYAALGLLVAPNIINVYADLNVMAASMQMLFGLPFALWLTVLTVAIVTAQIAIPYKHYVKVLKYTCLALLAYLVLAVLPRAHVHWGQALRGMVMPGWSSQRDYLLTVVGVLGTTISPYLFFWQAGEQVEEDIAEGLTDDAGRRTGRVRASEIRSVRSDTAVGMIASQLIAGAIIVSAAATLHASGHTNINTAPDAARALLPLGAAAYWLFGLGILGSGLLTVPTLGGSAAYAVSETLGWRNGLYRRFGRARGFYITLAAVIAVGYLLNFAHVISPLKALLYAAVLNGLAAPPLIVLLLLICNNRTIMGEHTNGWLANSVGALTAGLMGVAAAVFLWVTL